MLVVFLRAQFFWNALPYFFRFPFHHNSRAIIQSLDPEASHQPVSTGVPFWYRTITASRVRRLAMVKELVAGTKA